MREKQNKYFKDNLRVEEDGEGLERNRNNI